MCASDDREAQLDRLAEEFVARARAGSVPSVSEVAAAHPELADDIRRLFPLLTAMERAGGDGLAPGTVLGPYEIVREIGRGGMGVVYEARQMDLGRAVALKLLPPQATLDPAYLERFRQEARAAARLRHPNIVPVIGCGEQDGLHYFSMQYVRGRPLDTLREDVRGLLATGSAAAVRAHFARTARIGLAAAEGVAHAHAHGVLHRDVKPANVLLEGEDHVWIADFGLCRLAGSDSLTRTGDVLGTFRYLPPERFSGVSDVRGDVYGLGVTLYELLTGRRAYEEDDPAVLAARITREAPPRPRTLDRRVPADLETIVRTAMAHDPARRYPTAEALAADLRAWSAGLPIAARAPTFGYLLRRAVARNRPLAVAALAGVALLAASALWYVADLRRKEHVARRGLYVAQVAGAESSLRGGDGLTAAALLQGAPEDFRGWEWHHLQSCVERHVRRFEAPGDEVRAVAWAPDGAWFASAIGGEVWLHGGGDARQVRRLAPATPPTALAWSPTGERLAVGTRAGLELWSWPAGERLASVGSGDHRAVVYRADGEEILCAVEDGRLVRYAGADGAERGSVALEARALSLHLGVEDGRSTIVVGDGRGRVRALDGVTGEERWSRSVSARGVQSVAFLPEGRVAAAHDGLVRVWRASDGVEVRVHALGGHVHRLVHDPLGRRLLVLREGALHVFDVRTGEELQVLANDGPVVRAAVHPEGRRLVVASADGRLAEWYLGEGRDPLLLGRNVDDVLAVAVSPDGLRLASGGFGGILHVWDPLTGELTRAQFGHRGAITGVAFDTGGTRLLSLDDEGFLLEHDARGEARLGGWRAHEGPGVLAAGREPGVCFTLSRAGLLRRWQAGRGITAEAQHPAGGGQVGGAVRRLAVSRNGPWVATGDEAGEVRLWDAGSLRALRSIAAHEREVTGLAFDPRGARLASVSQDQTLRVWDVRTGRPTSASAPFEKGLAWSAGLLGVAWHPGGERVVTGSYRGTVGVWDPADARLIASLRQEHWISDLSFSPDGAVLFTALTSGEVRLWGSAPPREGVAARERALERAQAARPMVSALLERHGTPPRALAALDEMRDLDPEVGEGARRLLHAQSIERDALVERLWEALSPVRGPEEARASALALASGMWRAARRQERAHPLTDTLTLLGLLRAGDAQRVVDLHAQRAERDAGADPEAFVLDLAVLALAHEALADAAAAASTWGRLEARLRADPGLGAPRLAVLQAQRSMH